ncbi:nicotinate phosphoribosyltransferase [Thermovibrio sp.]
MKVKEFIEREGLKRLVNSEPNGFSPLPQVKEGVHSLQFFLKKEGGKVKECRFKASKRCKKLLALSELACRLLEEKGEVNGKELLSFFSGEKDKKKMEERVEIVLRALGK